MQNLGHVISEPANVNKTSQSGVINIQLQQLLQVKSFLLFQSLKSVAIKLSVQQLMILDWVSPGCLGVLHTIFKMM